MRTPMVVSGVFALWVSFLPACGSTRLCDAIAVEDIELAIRLVERGANVNAGGGCALHLAARPGQTRRVAPHSRGGSQPKERGVDGAQGRRDVA